MIMGTKDTNPRGIVMYYVHLIFKKRIPCHYVNIVTIEFPWNLV